MVCLEGSHPRGYICNVCNVCIYIYPYIYTHIHTYQSLSFLASQVLEIISWHMPGNGCQESLRFRQIRNSKQQQREEFQLQPCSIGPHSDLHSPAPAARNGSCTTMAMRKPRLEYHPAWSQTLTEITWELEAAEFSQLMSDFLIHQQLSEFLNC